MSSNDPSVIPFDLSCVGCSYNLRSLPREGTCPECGRAIEETLTSFRSTWQPSHITRWKQGCWITGASGLLTALAPAVGIAMVALESFFLAGVPTSEEVMIGAIMLVVLAEHALWALGLWRLAGGHPGTGLMGTGVMAVQRSAGLISLAIAGMVSLVMLEAVLNNGGMLNSDAGAVLLTLLILAGLSARMLGVAMLMRLMSRTLGSLGAIWKRRHVMVTGTFTLILCAAQFLATAALLPEIAGASHNDLFGFSVAVGIPSLMALPVVAIWASASIFRAGVAFKATVRD